MKLIAALLVVGLTGCSVAPYHSEFTRGGEKAEYKVDRNQCRDVAKNAATKEAYGETTGAVWWQSVQKNMVECMNGKGYERVRRE